MADADNINILKVNTSDLIELGATVNNFNIKNNTYITGQNKDNNGTINIVKVDGDNKLDFGNQVSVFNMKQNTYLTGRNADNIANVNIAKIDAQDRVDILDGSIVVKGSAPLADGQSPAAAVPNMPTASANETLMIFYKIVRNGAVQIGKLILDEDNSGLIEECSGDDCGVTFTEDAGTLDYTTTSTGNNATMTYTIIKL